MSEPNEERFPAVSNVTAEIFEQIIEHISDRIKEQTRCVLHFMKEILVKNVDIPQERVPERTGKHLVCRIIQVVEVVKDVSAMGAWCAAQMLGMVWKEAAVCPPNSWSPQGVCVLTMTKVSWVLLSSDWLESEKALDCLEQVVDFLVWHVLKGILQEIKDIPQERVSVRNGDWTVRVSESIFERSREPNVDVVELMPQILEQIVEVANVMRPSSILSRFGKFPFSNRRRDRGGGAIHFSGQCTVEQFVDVFARLFNYPSGTGF